MERNLCQDSFLSVYLIPERLISHKGPGRRTVVDPRIFFYVWEPRVGSGELSLDVKGVH